MKAMLYTQYGTATRVVKLQEVEKPVPTENRVLVKVYAAAVNPLDYHYVRGPIMVRLMGGGLLKPKSPKIGADFAGRVEAVGPGVTQFKPGDEVFGSGKGAFAEYILAREPYLVHKPANISYEQAAAIPVVAMTALQGLRDAGQIKAGQKVLVNGASGGIGTFAVQIAKSYGAEVTGVCSTRNVEMVRSIGADHVIDYKKEDFSRNGQQYDLIFDTIGNLSAFACQRALKPGGRCVSAGFTSVGNMILYTIIGKWITKNSDKMVGGMGMAEIKQDDMNFMGELLEAGKIKPVIDRCYPLSQTGEAISYVETKHARGKVIITVAS